MSYGFTTLRDLGSMDPQFPTMDLRNALNAGLVNNMGDKDLVPLSKRAGSVSQLHNKSDT